MVTIVIFLIIVHKISVVWLNLHLSRVSSLIPDIVFNYGYDLGVHHFVGSDGFVLLRCLVHLSDWLLRKLHPFGMCLILFSLSKWYKGYWHVD